MNSYCMNCLGEHPPALCPQRPREPLSQAMWVTREINLEALAFKRESPNTMSWRQRFEDDDPEAPPPTTSNNALVEQLSHRFSLSHAMAQETKLAGALERMRKDRHTRGEVATRVDELLNQSDAVLATMARDRMSRSRRFLDAAHELDPLDARIAIRQGFVLAMDGRPARAAAAFTGAANSLPRGTPPTLQGSATLLASRAHYLANQQKEAWELAGTAEQLLPNDGGVHYQKALVAARYPQADRSVKLCLRRAIDLDPAYFTLAALEPAFDNATWGQVIRPLLREIEDQGVQALLDKREAGRELFRELEDISASPGFSKLPYDVGGAPGTTRDAQGETRALLVQLRELFSEVDAALEKGPAHRSALEGQLHAGQQRCKHWILAWQRALVERIHQQIQAALPAEGEKFPKGSAKPLQRLAELVDHAEALETGVGHSPSILEIERSVARETRTLELLRAPKPRPPRAAKPAWRRVGGQVVFYVAVMVAVLAALGADLLVLHSQSFIDHPFLSTLGCAALTAYLPELVARLTRPREGGGAAWRLHELAFLPAYMVFPVLPAAGVVYAFPTATMFMLMMGVSALMSLLLIVGLTGRGR